MRNGSLFLAHPICGNKCMTSKNAQCSSRSGFRMFKISREVRVLKQSQSALFSSITHMTILSVFTCVMDVRYQAPLSIVTSLRPFCNRSCKVYFLTIEYQVFQFVPSTSTSEQFESILFNNSPTDFISLL